MLQAGRYKQTEIITADRTRIVIMLYEGAGNFLEIGRDKMVANDIPGKALYLDKATAVISELICSLDMESGGEIARNLRRLYDFMISQIAEANMRNEREPVDVVLKLLETLREGWEEVLRQESAVLAATSEPNENASRV